MTLKSSDQRSLNKHVTALIHERRASVRTDCFLEAVTLIDGNPWDSVYITNMSETGAKMIVTLGTELPACFHLLGICDTPVQCSLVWQEGRNAGVAFIKERQDTPTEH